MTNAGTSGSERRWARPSHGPVIALSRQHGARGAAVARHLAERLSFDCWDREVLAAVAAQVRVDASALAAFDERRPEPRETLADGAPLVGHGDYLRGLQRVAELIGRRGAMVVVGRGLGHMLDPEHTLRVRVVCPIEQRALGLCARSQLSPEAARATIDFVESERQAFEHALHGRDPDDPSGYDLLISTAALSVDAAAEVIATACHARFGVTRWPRATRARPVARPEVRPAVISANRDR